MEGCQTKRYRRIYGSSDLADVLALWERSRRQIVFQQYGVLSESLAMAELWYGPLLYALEGAGQSPDGPVVQRLVECLSDAVASVVMCAQGYYKNAFGNLRNVIEMSMGAVLAYQDGNAPNESLDITSRMPEWKQLAAIFSHPRFLAYQNAMLSLDDGALATWVDREAAHRYYDIWGSKPIHNHPLFRNAHYWDLADLKPRYDRGAMRVWLEQFAEINRRALLWAILGMPRLYAWTQEEHCLTEHPIEWGLAFSPAQLDWIRDEGVSQ